jgi:UDP-2-acetamido-3-amino-2,3-dideoxy-glucuronate N-acetyltransferase
MLPANVHIYQPSYVHPSARIGEGTKIGAFCEVGKEVVIGKNCNIQGHVIISNKCMVGDNVFIGPKTVILNDKYPFSHCLTPSKILDGVIIGGGVTILPNLTIGKNAVVGAGSVVTKNVPENTVVYGLPAKIIMSKAEYERKKGDFLKKCRENR